MTSQIKQRHYKSLEKILRCEVGIGVGASKLAKFLLTVYWDSNITKLSREIVEEGTGVRLRDKRIIVPDSKPLYDFDFDELIHFLSGHFLIFDNEEGDCWEAGQVIRNAVDKAKYDAPQLKLDKLLKWAKSAPESADKLYVIDVIEEGR